MRERLILSMLVAGLMAAMLPAAVAATGKSVDLGICSAGPYSGGVKVFAKDGGKGAARVMCSKTRMSGGFPGEFKDWAGHTEDRHLNIRNRRKGFPADI